MLRHRLWSRALHVGPRRSQRDPADFCHGLLESPMVMSLLSSIRERLSTLRRRGPTPDLALSSVFTLARVRERISEARPRGGAGSLDRDPRLRAAADDPALPALDRLPRGVGALRGDSRRRRLGTVVGGGTGGSRGPARPEVADASGLPLARPIVARRLRVGRLCCFSTTTRRSVADGSRHSAAVCLTRASAWRGRNW